MIWEDKRQTIIDGIRSVSREFEMLIPLPVDDLDTMTRVKLSLCIGNTTVLDTRVYPPFGTVEDIRKIAIAQATRLLLIRTDIELRDREFF